MALERDLGTITPSRFEDKDRAQIHHWFVKIELPSAQILRYTTRPIGWVGSLDPDNGEDVDAEWLGGEFTPEDLRVSQTNTSVLEVSSVTFGNIIHAATSTVGPWVNLDMTVGLKNRRVTVWHAWWPQADIFEQEYVLAQTPEGTYIIFRGRIGERVHNERSTLSLKPFRSSWDIKTGSQIYPTICRFAIAGLFKDAFTCQYVGAETTCDGFLTTCRETMNNEANFGGHPLMMKPNTLVYVGGQRINVS